MGVGLALIAPARSAGGVKSRRSPELRRAEQNPLLAAGAVAALRAPALRPPDQTAAQRGPGAAAHLAGTGGNAGCRFSFQPHGRHPPRLAAG